MHIDKDIEVELVDLENWKRPRLIAEYQRIYKNSSLECRSDQMLRRMVAYEWQEKLYGGLSQADRKLLSRLIKSFKKNPKGIWQQVFHIKPGTRLRRVWRGKLYDVTAKSDGFSYQQKDYGSLSEIATLITGVRWNGHLFFGIKKAKREKTHAAA